ncbi:MAG: restriction endonuclease [Ignavibacteria bacterium]|nr:restriction endonuclease [Ignavibacteria bacterium]
MSYDFASLNDKDLEALVHDVLLRKLSVDFQSFKMGIDKGIDLRYATNSNENEIIVQVKHLEHSGFNKFKSVLKITEMNKVVKLNPKRYILVTTVGLNPQNKEDIKSILSPYVISTNDILGKDDLISFLRNNNDIVETHFKLWLSSTHILKRILNNGVKGRSEFIEKNIRSRIKLFVPSKTHERAVEMLNKYHFLMITGAPGIGKTTLASILTYQLLADGFELVYVREIREAEDLFLNGKKQVFYFDDFLGTITLDLKSSRNADTAIVQFIERIKDDRQKRLLLTCRTTLLNQAKEESESILNSKIDLSKHEVTIEDYSDLDKARILYNHIYFSELDKKHKAVFFNNRFYWKVIKHKFYNPRIIEFFTDPERLQPNIEFSKQVIDFLHDPSKIWEKAFHIQISPSARILLLTLYSIRGGIYAISEAKLKEAFNARLEYEVKTNNYHVQSDTFNKVIRELLGSFIIRTHTRHENYYSTVDITFLNPSLEDFLFSYLSNNIDEYFSILKSATSFEPFKRHITTKHNKYIKNIYVSDSATILRLYAVFIERLPFLGNDKTSKINTVLILIRLFKWEDISEKVVSLMNALALDNIGWKDYDDVIEIIEYITNHDYFEQFTFSKEDILTKLSYKMEYHFQIQTFSKFISENDAFKNIITNSKIHNIEYYKSIQNNIDDSWELCIEFYIKQNIKSIRITSEQDLLTEVSNCRVQAQQINALINIDVSPIINDHIYDYENLLKKIKSTNADQESQIISVKSKSKIQNEPLEVNRLFNNESEESDGLPF